VASPRAVLWDLDGTLLDSRLSIRDTLNTVVAERSLKPFAKAELDGLIGKPLRDILATRTGDAQLIEAMTHRYREAYNESGWVTVRVYPGLEALVKELHGRGVPQGIVTSKGQRETEVLLADLGLTRFFEVVVGDDDVRPLKPDPAPVLEACRRLGVDPATVVMVGDTRFDVGAAKGAGAAAVGVLWGIQDEATLREAGADRLVADAAHLRRLLL
jgi:phosphoglycolate phosphatase